MNSDIRLELVDNGASADLFVYGYIGRTWDGDGVNAKDIAKALAKSKAKIINVSINSGGGSAFDGVAIYNALRSHSARVIARIDGLAASAASVIAMAADEVIMPKGSFLMIHNASTFAWGEASELRKTADMLEKVSTEFISIYSHKSGATTDEIKQQLDDETWFTPSEAKEAGYADTIDDEAEVDAYTAGPVAMFGGVGMPAAMFPQQVLNTLRTAAAPTPAPAEPKEPKAMDLEKLKTDHPELYAQIVASAAKDAADTARAEGATAERARIDEIEQAAVPGYEDLVAKAKADPTMTGRDLAFEITQSIKRRGSAYLADRNADAEEIGNAGTAPNPTAHLYKGNAVEAKRESLIDAMVSDFDATPDRDVE